MPASREHNGGGRRNEITIVLRVEITRSMPSKCVSWVRDETAIRASEEISMPQVDEGGEGRVGHQCLRTSGYSFLRAAISCPRQTSCSPSFS